MTSAVLNASGIRAVTVTRGALDFDTGVKRVTQSHDDVDLLSPFESPFDMSPSSSPRVTSPKVPKLPPPRS